MKAPLAADDDATPFGTLDPSLVLTTIEQTGLRCSGRVLTLNSFENRVYQVELEDGTALVAKFYRPARWSDAAILEEHAFLAELVEAELDVVAPLQLHGQSLFFHGRHRFSLWPRVGGRAPDLEQPEQLRQLGRTLARLHVVGARRPFVARQRLAPQDLQRDLDILLASPWPPDYLRDNLAALGAALQERVASRWLALAPRLQRIHGDLHAGNLLWREPRLWLVDFDDALTGPAVQDLWMLLDSAPEPRARQLDALLEGYTLMRDFDLAELGLIESLRALRMLRHHAWIAQRWHDPAFPAAFPDYASPRHWEQLVAHLQEQLGILQEGD